MASIFTFEPDLPRVSSPWLKQADGLAGPIAAPSTSYPSQVQQPNTKLLVTRLEAEPQEGPVEYKLHLLLRPRRKFLHLRMLGNDIGKGQTKYGGPPSRSVSQSAAPPFAAGSPAPVAVQSRKHRLEQLTTQLLWRLQQSSPHYATSASNLVLPHLPESVAELQTPPRPGKLLRGLEESQGALYEIGISDDGTFVGLTEDEMQESLHNLRAMASCVGCDVQVLRMVQVGQASWIDDESVGGATQRHSHTGKLVVAEALVKPYLGDTLSEFQEETPLSKSTTSATTPEAADTIVQPSQTTSQLRISLTGATMSGKSSLLGTLTTSTFDNGRGKSRLTMLKHRHEINTGVTSSVTQELFGYAYVQGDGADVVNYATENVSSWIDIHAASHGDRLVFVSDSAGHPRYRRTTVRGLVGWMPHWTLLCIPADDCDDMTSGDGNSPLLSDANGLSALDVDLSAAHLDLCLRLDLPIVVVITKLDVASRNGLRSTLAKVLSLLKGAGKRPLIVPNSPGQVAEYDLQFLPETFLRTVQDVMLSAGEDPAISVPIIMTSAVQGIGIQTLHGVLSQLPIPTVPDATHGTLLFSIEDVYNKAEEPQLNIVSGRLACGKINVGDRLYVGPFSSLHEESDDSDGQKALRPSSSLTSKSFPGAPSPARFLRQKTLADSQEWRAVQVTSIRNLRLPVRSLHADQVGTIGFKACDDRAESLHAQSATTSTLRLRKGMVLLASAGKASSGFVAEFRREDLGSLAVGSHVVVYISSIRASARILSAGISDRESTDDSSENHPSSRWADHLEADRQATSISDVVAGAVTHDYLLVTFHFEASREYIVTGSQILVMPGGGPGLYGGTERGEKGVAGLEGFVGRIVEVLE